MEEPTLQDNNIKSRFYLLLLFGIILALVWTGWPFIREQIQAVGAVHTETQPAAAPTGTITLTETDPPTALPIAETTLDLRATLEPNSLNEGLGAIVLAMSDGPYTHLFVLDPQTLLLSRLTNHPWDDMHPALSPDGTRLAYTSRRNGYWNIYVMELRSGELVQVTDTFEYEGAPTWSPDGQWLAYETYARGNLDIYVQSISDLNQPPVQLTDSPSADHSPAWSPLGREIAFVSNRSGIEDIWTARLDQIENRFTNLTDNPGSPDRQPAWSPDGRYLTWTGKYNDYLQVLRLDTQNPQIPPQPLLAGDHAAWSPLGDTLLVRQSTPTLYSLAALHADGSGLSMPIINLPADLHGFDWRDGLSLELLQSRLVEIPAAFSKLWQPQLDLASIKPTGRYGLVELPEVNVAHPYLHDQVDEAFAALRAEAGRQAGWDVLGNLENAYLPITEAPNPGNVDEWLYTGRAFALNPLPVQAGWMAVVREGYGGQVFWRIFVRTRYQDGSQGQPMKAAIWDMDARYSGDARTYEQGGAFGEIPPGYWIDFTELAARYGWYPLPALHNWRTYYPASRFNQFVKTDGLSWEAAMAQLYPPEALQVPTQIPTFTLTPTLTPTIRFYRSVTPLPSATATPPPSFRPTWTPLPGGS